MIFQNFVPFFFQPWNSKSEEKKKSTKLQWIWQYWKAQRDQLIDEGRMVEDALADVRAQTDEAEAEVQIIRRTFWQK